MKRQIKFRAFDNSNKELLPANECFGMDPNGGYWQYADQGFYVNDKEDKEDEFTLSQFIGLKDKNNIEVYEGDVLLCKNATEPEDKGFICVFEKSAFRFKNIRYPNDEKYDIKLDEYDYIHEQLEIIGNKFQNPELLK